jgi:hypothetical protein
MLNVDCKILSVLNASELVEKARELEYHFETEGSPVMIGMFQVVFVFIMDKKSRFLGGFVFVKIYKLVYLFLLFFY